MPMSILHEFFHLSKDNCVLATQQLLRLLKVNVTNESLENALKGHPDYPSLLSVYESITQWGVKTKAVKVSRENFASVPCPFMAHVREGTQTRFVTVGDVTETQVIFYNDSNKPVSEKRMHFLGRWTGVILLAEAEDTAGEEDYRLKQRSAMASRVGIGLTFLTPLIFFSLQAFLSSGQQRTAVWMMVIYSILKLSGLVVGGLLLMGELDQHNPLLKKICGVGKTTGCGAVLSAKSSKVFAGISWGDIGFAYFSGGLLSLFMSHFSPGAVYAASLLSLLSVGFIPYSLYQQNYVIGRWCPLCLTTLAILFCEFCCAVWIHPFPMAFSVNMLEQTGSLIAFICIPLFLRQVIKPLQLKAKEGVLKGHSLSKLMRNQQVFRSTLTNQKAVSGHEGLGILIGRPDAANKVVKVCNPYCPPCIQSHSTIGAIARSGHDVSVQIIFTATAEESDVRSFPAKHLLALYDRNDPALILQALDDWYHHPSYDDFALKYPLPVDINQQGPKLTAMRRWCDMTGVAATPTFFVNGHELPAIYTLNDVRYFLSV
nr:vitamin K epoxide reductase family protein [uncultured Chitinophaga sp.]